MKRFKVVNGKVVRTTTETERTFWNGRLCNAQRVRVIVAADPSESSWYRDLAGAERAAVRIQVSQLSKPFYIDNEDGSGWLKVTKGHGSPKLGHSSLRIEREVQE